jgi:hypothetical protein
MIGGEKKVYVLNMYSFFFLVITPKQIHYNNYLYSIHIVLGTYYK